MYKIVASQYVFIHSFTGALPHPTYGTCCETELLFLITQLLRQDLDSIQISSASLGIIREIPSIKDDLDLDLYI